MSDARQGDGWFGPEDRRNRANLRPNQTTTPAPYEDPYAWVPPSWQRSEVNPLGGRAPTSHRPAHRKRTRRKVWPAVALAMVVVGVAGVGYALVEGSGQKAALPFTGPASPEGAGTQLAGRWTTLTDTAIQDLVPLAQVAVATPLGSVRATAASTSSLTAVRNSASSATDLLTNYISQLGSLHWTISAQVPSHALIQSSVAYRNGFERIQAFNGSTTSAMIAEARSMVSTDASNWRAALLTVTAALGIKDPIVSGLH